MLLPMNGVRTATSANFGSATNRCGPAPTKTVGLAGSKRRVPIRSKAIGTLPTRSSAKGLVTQCCSAWAVPASVRKFWHRSSAAKPVSRACRFSNSTVPAQVKAIEVHGRSCQDAVHCIEQVGLDDRAQRLQGLFLQARQRHRRCGQGRQAFHRHHRSGLVAGKNREGAKFPQDVLWRAQHRRPLFRAVAVRPGAGGHRRHRHRSGSRSWRG